MTLLDKKGVILVDYDPMANGGSEAIRRDFQNSILKLNLVERGVEAAKEAVAGKSGVMYSLHNRKKIMQIAGYSTINDKKFIDSIGWTVLIREDKDELIADIIREEKIFFIGMLILLTIGVTVSVIFANRLAKALLTLSHRLSTDGDQVASASAQAAASSAELSASTSEQAAALQETVAAIDEISAMIAKSADTAKRSNTYSEQSRETAMRGKQSVVGMLNAVSDISASNTTIMEEVENSNKEISEIVRLISDISNKTKVINDIVFQTKLLSFNASVEASRAGEHGKGFAVVAEEVGNLAQMSGNAAKEIATMLASSIERVECIVEKTRSKMSTLVQSGREKIDLGMARAKECETALEEILTNVAQVSELVNEIAHACQEQDQGIKQVATSMGQMDDVTQQNANVATQSSDVAENLSERSASLKLSVHDLLLLIGADSQHPKDNGTIEKTSDAVDEAAEPSSLKNTPGKLFKLSGSKDAQARRQAFRSENVTKYAVGSNLKVPHHDDPRFHDDAQSD